MSKVLLMLFVALLSFPKDIMAQAINEDFENVTLTDQDGNPLTSTWAYGYGMSNGWKIIGGTIYGSAGTTNYGLWSQGRDSSKSLEASYSSTNAAHVFIPQLLSGDVTFWARKTSSDSRTNGYVKVYEADADGNVNTGKVLYEQTLTSTAWTMKVFSVSSKYIAINLVRAAIDDFSATAGTGEVQQDPGKPQCTAFTRTSAYSVNAGEDNTFSASFGVTVKNVGDLPLDAADVVAKVTDAEGNVVGTAAATEALAAGESVTLDVDITADAGEGGTFTFYACAQGIDGQADQYFLNSSGQKAGVTVSVTAYRAAFAIHEEGAYAQVDSGEAFDYGFTQTAVGKVFEIRNSGTAPLAVSSVTVPEGFSVSESAFTVAAGANATFTVSIDPATGKTGTVGGTVEIAHSLGSFSFAVSGIIVDEATFFENFQGRDIPSTWTNEGSWTATYTGYSNPNYYAQQNSSVGATRLITPRLTIAEGQSLMLQAARVYTATPATLSIYYAASLNTPTGEWTKVGDFGDQITSSVFTTLTVEGFAPGKYYVAFEGNGVKLDNVLGFQYDKEAPLLALFDADGHALADQAVVDFGRQTATTDKVFVVRNNGTGTLQALVEASGDFTTTTDEVALAAGEQAEITVTMAVPAYGGKSGQLYIVSDDQEITIALTGTGVDPEAFVADFNDQQWPRGWLVGDNWSIDNFDSDDKSDYYAENVKYQGQPGTILTPRMVVADNDIMLFEARRYSAADYYAPVLRFYYSADRSDWTLAADFSSVLTTEADVYGLENIPAGTYYFMIEGLNVQMDNLEGFRLVADDHLVDFVSVESPAEVTVNHRATFSATVQNLWAESEPVVLEVYAGDELADKIETTLAYGQQQTISYSFVPHAAAEAQEVRFQLSYSNAVQTSIVSYDIVEESDEYFAHTVSGIVKDADGEALEAVELTFTNAQEEAVYTAVTDGEGRFSLKIWRGNLTYDVTAVKEGFKNATLTGFAFVIGDVDDFEMTLEKQTPTGLARMKGSAADATTHDLGGRMTGGKKKGLYIINGKKIVRK